MLLPGTMELTVYFPGQAAAEKCAVKRAFEVRPPIAVRMVQAPDKPELRA